MQTLKILFWVAVSPIVFYFIPTIVAYGNDDPQVWSIFWANLLFGWSGFGWVACLGIAIYHAQQKIATQ